MTGRPYISFRIEQLEELASGIESQPNLSAPLIAELEHRRNHRARKLLNQLTSTGGTSQRSSPQDTSRSSSIAADRASDVDSEKDSHTESTNYEALRERYEELRKTFTVEGELLARWGMTPSLPLDLQEFVFESWRRIVEVETDSDRTILELESDRARIAEERDAFSKSQELLSMRGYRFVSGADGANR